MAQESLRLRPDDHARRVDLRHLPVEQLELETTGQGIPRDEAEVRRVDDHRAVADGDDVDRHAGVAGRGPRERRDRRSALPHRLYHAVRAHPCNGRIVAGPGDYGVVDDRVRGVANDRRQGGRLTDGQSGVGGRNAHGGGPGGRGIRPTGVGAQGILVGA